MTHLRQLYGRFFITFAGLVLLCSCAGKDNPQPNDDNFTISVDFREVHRCSRISPEITVAYAPVGTKFYDVRLIENGNGERFLGGGRWLEDGSGIIPEGALTSHYSGPCPPKDKRIEYTYVVSAMEEGSEQPLEVRLYRFSPDD